MFDQLEVKLLATFGQTSVITQIVDLQMIRSPGSPYNVKQKSIKMIIACISLLNDHHPFAATIIKQVAFTQHSDDSW
jgi:hypothetical protein